MSCHLLLVRSVGVGLLGAAVIACCCPGPIKPRQTPDTAAAEGSGGTETEASSGPPPLVVDKDAPLLLLDEPSGADAAGASAATPAARENQACFVCHANYQEEPLVTDHVNEDVGCTDCHGESYPHRNDENNTTPPDIMFPATAIAPACRKCHETHDVPPEEVVARWMERCPTKTDSYELVCTDCHGNHRLHIRTVRWDKQTRKLIQASNGGGASHQ